MANDDDTIDKKNIQGSIWPRLPKYFESYLFFKITDEERFRKDLRKFSEHITNGADCEEYFKKTKSLEEASRESRVDIPEEHRKPFTAVNVAFSHTGLLRVRLLPTYFHH